VPEDLPGDPLNDYQLAESDLKLQLQVPKHQLAQTPTSAALKTLDWENYRV
jgi:hypothetical protein